MTDKERKKRRELLQKQIQNRFATKTEKEQKAMDLFLFRLYVTGVICGCLFVLSLFHTDTAEYVVKNVKENIAKEMPMETILQKGKEIKVFLQNNTKDLPVFLPQEEKETEETEDIQGEAP